MDWSLYGYHGRGTVNGRNVRTVACCWRPILMGGLNGAIRDLSTNVIHDRLVHVDG
jgi:hypothetical protein